MASLYKINGELLQLVNQIEDQGGEISPEQESALAITQEQLSEKVVAYDGIIKQIQADMNLGIAELKRIEEYIERKRKAVENLQRFLLQSLLLFGQEQPNGVKKLECGTVTLTTRKNPKSVEHIDEVPQKYRRYDMKISSLDWAELEAIREVAISMGLSFIVTAKVSKTALKEDLEQGPVHGAWFKEGDIKLVIK